MAELRSEPHPRSKTLAAEAWAEVRDLLDLQLSPLGRRAIDALAPKAGETILDIGCGAGETLLQLAERVGPGGRVIGVDIASRLVGIARRRAEGSDQIEIIEADAQTVDLPIGTVDGLFSRFGVMAFDDPVAAFSNLRRMMTPAGRLAFVCWRSLDENELDLMPIRAAGLEALVDTTPFSFEDPDRVRTILSRAGFQNVAIDADDQTVSSGDLDAMATVLLRVGPLGRILRENPGLRPAAEPRLRAALAARSDPACVALTAATWIVTATI